MKLFIIMALAVVLLSGCATSPEQISYTKPLKTEIATEKTISIPDPLTVSALATEDFMLPFDKFSWEREYPAEYVMIHFTSAVMTCPDDPYNISEVRKIFEDYEVSINYIIERDGTVRCYIPENRAAWHAGKGTFKGIEKLTDAMNRYSLGIELVAIGSQQDMSIYMTADDYAQLGCDKGFTDEQYEALIPLVRDICERNGIPYTRDFVIGHSEYKTEKTDPGELFDWSKLF